MYRKNKMKAIIALTIALAFVLPGAFASDKTIDVTTYLKNTDNIENMVEISTSDNYDLDIEDIVTIVAEETIDNAMPTLMPLTDNIIYVGSGPGNDSATIQGGINLAGTGDTVYVHNGVYYEHVTINKQLNLIGQSREDVIVDGSGTGRVFYVTARGMSMNKFTITNGEYGIYFSDSPGSKLRNNTIYNNSNNFFVMGWFVEDFIYDIDTSNTINGRPIYYLIEQSDIELNETHNFGYLGLISCNNIVAKNSDVSGVMLVNTINSKISNISCHNSIHGIYLWWYSRNNKIENCSSYNNSCGIYLDVESSNNDITNCTCYNNSGCGIFPNRLCSNSNIINCTSYNNNQYGIFLGRSPSSNIINCDSYNNNYGIYLYYSPKSKLRSNTIYNNAYSFGVKGQYISDFEYDIDPSNTINGRPIYYLIEQSDIELNETHNFGYLGLISCNNIVAKNSDVGGILLVDTTDSTISNVNSHNSGNGIYLGHSSNNNITDCDSYNNSGTYGDGIYLEYSSNNDITDCDSYNNSHHGICLEYSSNNNIINCNSYNNFMYGVFLLYSSNYNNIINCNLYNNDYGIYFFCPSNCNIANCTIYNNFGDGIYLYYSLDNKFTNCTLYNNNYGIYLEYSFYNLIHHNNLINNVENAYDDSTGYYKNQWDDGSEGNYWNDYTGVDENGDGIGDTPYNITGGSNQDRFPLMMIMDNTPPIITDITAIPEVQKPNEPVNITCIVIDIQIATVKVHIDGPEGFMLEEEMNEGSSYYYENTYTLLGGYYYYIWANDTSGNIAVSPTYMFVIMEFDKPISIVDSLPTWTKIIPFMVTATTYGDIEVANVTLWYRYSSDKTDWTEWTSYGTDEDEPWSWEFIGNDGYYEFYSIAVDEDENEEDPPSTADASTGIDTVNPITIVILDGTMGGEEWYNSSVKVTLSATDELSGVESTWYFDSDIWELYTGPFTVSDEGYHTVYYYSFDKAGNKEDTKSVDFKIDKTAPVTDHEFDGDIGDEDWFVSDVTVTLSAMDIASGINYTKYKIDNSIWMNYTEPFDITEDGEYTLYYYSVDFAGNIEIDKGPFDFKIDQTAPEIELFVEKQGIRKWLFTVDASDEMSGVNRVEFYYDGELLGTVTEEPYEWEYSGSSGENAMAVAYDNAGNSAEDEKPVSYSLQNRFQMLMQTIRVWIIKILSMK